MMKLDIKAENYINPKEPTMGLTKKGEMYYGFTYPKTETQISKETLMQTKQKIKKIQIKPYINCYLKKSNNNKIVIITEYDKEYQEQNFRYQLTPKDKNISVKMIKTIMQQKTPQINETQLFEKIKKQIKKYVYLKMEAEYDIITSYTMLTYKYLFFDFMPILHLNGEAGTGKSQIGKIMTKMSYNSSVTVSTTRSSFFRRIDKRRGLYFMDEKENLEEYEKELLNGCTYEGNVHTLTEKADETFSEIEFQIYTPIVLACINEIYGATSTRMIKIETVRPPLKTQKYDVIRLTEDTEHWQEIRDELIIWSLQTNHKDQELMRVTPEINKILNNRGIDAWKLIINLLKRNNKQKQIEEYIQNYYNEQIEEHYSNDTNFKFIKWLTKKQENKWIKAIDLYQEFCMEITEKETQYFNLTRFGKLMRRIGYGYQQENKRKSMHGIEYKLNNEQIINYMHNNYEFTNENDWTETFERQKENE